MLATILFGTLAFAQAGSLGVIDEPMREQREVAYDALVTGEARAAVEALEALRADNPGDPALLINLGSAYAALGDTARAEAAYREAATSDIRYQLELADGSWTDSRRAARTALRALEQSRVAMN
ncbi:hypothetical protein M3P36_04815 [Altererythrobacter sp. KTW20L]|uniref:tetratricopeptide repeat protein n=1 Tax=Altererythrobacter sp. KTW20L TaxID=2942210 RepID=UPI0020BEF967|nr:tetratricopeptide repeat protein [Altererythrobacter sp. KTW20L]MCL6250371.1 hypothetical protein [Altererythrobacter sp. KTW20L]